MADLRDAWRVYQDCRSRGTCQDPYGGGSPTGPGSTNTGTAPPNPPPPPPPPPPEDDMTVIIPNMPPPPGSDPFGGGGFGFNPTGGGGIATTGGGGAPDWMCRVAGIQAGCTYAELILAGAGHLFGGSGSEAPGGPAVPGSGLADPGNGSGPCPGLMSVRNPITGECVNLDALPPGGAPATSPSQFQAVRGMYGAGFQPKSRQVRRSVCPKGTVLGDDGVCYKGLARTRRMWDPGMKPLLTGGDRAAIRKAASAARKLKRSKKMIRKASRALDKVC